jgi:hypothetical protein
MGCNCAGFLRTDDVENIVSLDTDPQLIVCGDWSSGKSSVLSLNQQWVDNTLPLRPPLFGDNL